MVATSCAWSSAPSRGIPQVLAQAWVAAKAGRRRRRRKARASSRRASPLRGVSRTRCYIYCYRCCYLHSVAAERPLAASATQPVRSCWSLQAPQRPDLRLRKRDQRPRAGRARAPRPRGPCGRSSSLSDVARRDRTSAATQRHGVAHLGHHRAPPSGGVRLFCVPHEPGERAERDDVRSGAREQDGLRVVSGVSQNEPMARTDSRSDRTSRCRPAGRTPG